MSIEQTGTSVGRDEVIRCTASSRSRRASDLTPREWSNEVGRRYGVQLHSGSSGLSGARIRAWSLGEIAVIDLVSGCCTATFADGHNTLAEDSLILKLLIEGAATIEQGGRLSSVGPGGLVAACPTRDLVETFPTPARMGIFHLPKRLLRGRGIPASMSGTVVPDMRQPDMLMVSDLLLSIVHRSAGVGTDYARRLEQQLLDHMDVILSHSSSVRENGGAQATLYRARAFIRRNFGNPDLDAEAIGEALHLSVNYLNRLFRTEETSLMRYLWSVRLDQAARQLRQQPKRRVDQIAYACGFSSAAHFSRTFRARFGVAPSQIRQSDAWQGQANGIVEANIFARRG